VRHREQLRAIVAAISQQTKQDILKALKPLTE
jgi:hypothetical protein